MNSMKFKLASRLFAVVAAFCLTLQLSAVNKFYIEPFSVESYDVVTVPVMLALDENTGAQGFQFEVTLPAQLTMAKAPEKNTERLTAGHSLSFNAANNRVILSSLNNSPIKGTTGPVINLYVKAKDGALPEAGEGRIELVNVKLTAPGEGQFDVAKQLDVEAEGAAVMMQTGRAWASFTEQEIVINPDGTARLNIAIDNSVSLRGFQMDIAMPAGFTIDGDPELSSDRCNPNLMIMPYDNTTHYTIVGMIMGSTDPILFGNSGVVFSINVKAPADYSAADGKIVLRNAEFSNMTNGTIVASAGKETSTVNVRNGAIAHNKALGEIKALEDALAAALKDIELNAYDVKDQFTGDEIAGKINDLKAAVEAAYNDLSLTDNYSSVMSPAEGIRSDIDKLVADAKAAQKAHDEEVAAEAAREKAYKDANAVVKSLQDALATALNTIATECPDVKNDFKGEAINDKINSMKSAIDAAYADKTIADKYNNLVAPADGIRSDIDKLIADAKAAQKAHDEEAAREKAYKDANAVVKSLEDALTAALNTIATECPDVKDNFKGEAIKDKINDMKLAILAAYNDKTIAGKYNDLVAPATGIRSDIEKLIADAKAAQKAFDDAEAACEKAYKDANAVVKSLEDALTAALNTIATECPDVKDDFKGEAISDKINNMKSAIEAAYADKSIAGKYDNLVAPADGIRSDIDKLIADAKAAQKAFEDDAKLQKAYKDAKDELAALEKALQDALDAIAKDAPDVKDDFTGDAISRSISDLRADILEAYADKTLGENYDDVMSAADDIEAAIEALIADAKAAQEALEAEQARDEANQEAYQKDVDAIDALEKALEDKLAELKEKYPDYDTSEAEAAIRDAIEAERDKAADALAAVENEGEYSNTVDTAAIEDMIANLGSDAGIGIIFADELAEDVVIYNLAGRRLMRPAVGQINIIVHANGTVQKAIVK